MIEVINTLVLLLAALKWFHYYCLSNGLVHYYELKTAQKLDKYQLNDIAVNSALKIFRYFFGFFK